MIDVPALNSKLVAQDEALRQKFSCLIESITDDRPGQALVEVVAEGLAAIHERQGNLITLMLRMSH